LGFGIGAECSPERAQRGIHRLLLGNAAHRRIASEKIVSYPPDLQDAAVQNVLQQAEALSAEWAA
jgi:hypothetical protein